MTIKEKIINEINDTRESFLKEGLEMYRLEIYLDEDGEIHICQICD